MKKLDNMLDKLLTWLTHVQNQLADILETKFKEAGVIDKLDKLDKDHFHTKDDEEM